MIYQIRAQGYLGDPLRAWFARRHMNNEPLGEATLTGPLCVKEPIA
ncbi:MAG: hypothetical protein R2867_37140 [Caldilineaceae bacterium]